MRKWKKDWYKKVFEPKNTGEFKAIECSTELYEWMKALTQACAIEISGFGKSHIEEREDGKYIVLDSLEVFEQECSGGSTEIGEEELTNMYLGAIAKGDKPEDYNFWWHSHVDFNTFFSGTDETALETLSKDDGFAVAICTNKRDNVAATIYRDGDEIGEKTVFRVTNMPENKYRQAAEDAVRDKVTVVYHKEKKAKTYSKFNYGYKPGRYGGHYDFD